MSKYEDLTDLATRHSEDFHKRRDQCARMAARLAHELETYLGAPDGQIRFARLDDELRREGDLLPIGGLPKVRMGDDKRWYCGINIHFESRKRSAYSSVTMIIGIRPHDGGFSVKWHREFFIDPNAPNAFAPILEHIYGELLEDYTRGPGEPSAAIGFLNGIKSDHEAP